MTIVEAEDERLLITNLFMKTQPVIRYEVTDMVRLDPDPCPCGRPTRTVSAIEGRSDDILELPADAGGTVRIHPIHLRSPLAHLDTVAPVPGGAARRRPAPARRAAGDARRPARSTPR